MFNNYDEHYKFWYQPDVTFEQAIYVHPLKQWDLQLIYDSLWEQSNVLLLVVFGSAVTLGCHSESDIDLYIETADGKSNYHLPSYLYLSSEIDTIENMKDWNCNIGREIAEKGIVLFDRR